MIDKEAQKLGFIIRAHKRGYTIGAAAAAAALAAGIYFGHFYTGWIGIPKTEYQYYISQGDLLENTWITQADEYYYTDENAKMVRGIRTIKDNIYAFGEKGAMIKGWLDTDEGRMYLGADGKAARGWETIEEVVYYFDEDGIEQTGWLQLEDGKYYLEESGAQVTGWKEIGQSRYYFNEDGVMQTGWVEVDGTWYLMAESGEMMTGEQVVDGKTYWLGDDGTMFTGWYESDDGKRYYTPSGEAAKGWTEINGQRYFFGDDFLMQTGSIELDGENYYLEDDGSVDPGWHESDDGDFYVCSDGYVLDLDEKIGDFGRLVIRTAGIDVAVYTTDEREDYQEVVDEEDSAVAVKERHDLEYVIADRRSQGFDLEGVEEGARAYLIEGTSTITEYVCTRVCKGTNDGEDVTDDEGTSLWKQNEDGFCTYSSAGTEDQTEIIAAFWQEAEEDGEE